MSEFIEKVIYFSPLVRATIVFILIALAFYFEDIHIGHLKKKKVLNQLIIGIAFGIGVIHANELGSINIGGAMINARDTGPLLAGLLFGMPAGIIAGIIGGTERFLAVYWGAGAYTRIACSSACVLAGILAGVFRTFVFHKKIPKPLSGFFLAIVSEVIHLLLVFFTHPSDPIGAFAVVQICTVPMISATCISVLVSLLFVDFYSNKIDEKNGVKKNLLPDITETLQKRIFAIIVIAFFLSIAFQAFLLNNTTRTQCEKNISVVVDDAYKKINKGYNKYTVKEEAFIGQTGSILILDDNFVPMNESGDSDTKRATLVIKDVNKVKEGTLFDVIVNDEDCLCMYRGVSGEKILGYFPKSEAYFGNNMQIHISAFLFVIVFAILYVQIFVLVNMLIVNNIKKINGTLEKIADGNLDEEVNVKMFYEFDILSNGINKMVLSLKKLIAEAKARIAAELEYARKIQYAALPVSFSSASGEKRYDIYANMTPAKEVGGDFYDFYYLGEKKFVFLVADVSGKGIPAAMFMMKAKSTIKSFAESNPNIDQVATWANNELAENNNEMFVTAFICVIDLSTGKVEYVNAGHNPPVYIHKNGKAEYFDCKKNLVFAGMEGINYKKGEFTMEKGDVMFLYTDGVTEAIDKDENMYGEDRLLKVIDRSKLESMSGLCNNIFDDLKVFANGADQFDDITMVGFRYEGA